MIFAAGLGSRLRPLTDRRPKALVEIAGRPMLEHLILKLKRAGVGHVVVNVHHFGGQIIDFLAAHDGFGLRVEISDERGQLLDTGGGLKKAAPMLGGDAPVLVHNVDIVSDLDLPGLYEAYGREAAVSGCDAMLAVNVRETSRYLLFDDEKRLRGWIHTGSGEVKSPVSEFDAEACARRAFTGIHLFHPALFADMRPWEGAFSIIDFYLAVSARKKIVAYEVPEGTRWVDAGKPAALEKAAAIAAAYERRGTALSDAERAVGE